MNPIEAALRRVDRYQQRHPLVGLPFAMMKKFGDDKGGNLITLLAWNGFFALLPLLLVLVTLLGYLLRRNPAMQQQLLHSAFAEFPIIGNQLQLTGFGSLGNRSAVFRLANLAVAAGLNVGLFLLGFRALTPRQVPCAGSWRERWWPGSLAGAAGRRRLPGRPQA
jgi:hypothetical protein